MATTTNYSWTTPDDTDLVKDGAAAIRTLGSSADTTVKNLNPGTTAGDIDYYTSSTAKARIAIGTAGQVLQVNAGATAPEWAAPASGSTYAGCVLYSSGGQTINNATGTAHNWDSEELDTDGFHSTVTNNERITIPAGKNGKYMVHTQITWTNNGTGERVIALYKNNSLYVFNRGITNSTNSNSRVAMWVLDLVATDFIEIRVIQSSGGSLDTLGANMGWGNTLSYFGAYLIGA